MRATGQPRPCRGQGRRIPASSSQGAVRAAVERRRCPPAPADRVEEGGRGGRRQVRHQAAGAVGPLYDQGMAAEAAHRSGAQPRLAGRNPDCDEIHVIPIEDEKTAELGFEAGDLDYTWVSVSSIPRYLKEPPKGGKFVAKPSLAYVWLGMNKESEPFDNPNVRRAVQHAIDVPRRARRRLFRRCRAGDRHHRARPRRPSRKGALQL